MIFISCVFAFEFTSYTAPNFFATSFSTLVFSVFALVFFTFSLACSIAVLNNVASDTLMEGVLYDIRSSTIAPGTLESLYTRLAPQSFSNVFYP